MNKLLIALVLSLSLCGEASAENFKHKYLETNEDIGVASHYILGGVVGGLTSYYLPQDMNKGWKFVAGVVAGALAGCVSESLDKNWDNKDLSQWAMGGVIGSAVITINF